MNPLTSIGRLGGVAGIDSAAALSGADRPGNASFGKSLEAALAGLSRQQNEAQTMTREFQAENPEVTLEETMIALQQSSLSFQAAVQVRNKLVAAYNEIMNMQV